MGDHVNEQSLIHSDALNRAARTLYQGVGVDAAIAIGAGALILINDVDVSSGIFWESLGFLILKSFLVSGASYLARLKLAPKS